MRVAVLTVSTSRYEKKMRGEEYVDESGDLAVSMLREMGYQVDYLGVVNDDITMIRRTVVRAAGENYDAIIITGGTGLSPRDVTIEALAPLLDKEIEGFGEIFRVESYRRVGAAAALSRATAGIHSGKLVMALPGSPNAVRTALELFGKELPHAIFIARGLH
ncbi:MAG: MogA/MoaB family molybdenum cofactor biosynthesis protein [Nitrososphaerota archaeon]